MPFMAQAAPIMPGRNTSLELIANKDAAVPGETVMLAIRIRIADKWHIYWENPGDSGDALRLKWDALPEGFKLGDLQWPVPKRLPYGPLINYGYEKEALIFSTLSVPKGATAGEVTLKAKAEILVCEEICIPEFQDISLTLPVADSAKPANAFLFERGAKHLIYGTDVPSRYYEENGNLVLLLAENYTLDDIEAVFPAEWGVIENAAEQKIEDTKQGTKITVQRGTRAINDAALDRMTFVLRDVNGDGLAVFADRISAADAAQMTASHAGWITAVLLAVLGGLILNLMPCVFPILSLKALSLVKLSQAERTHAKGSALAYTAGILLCFVGLAAVLLALRGAGESIGWGFQLQSPELVTVLAWLMALVGFNLLGFFEVNNFVRWGDKLAHAHGLLGSFFTGVLAAVVATPCTAPFMATALGVALVQPWYIAILIFAALGFGLALPFLLISFVPALARALPKPGLWMERFRQFLAFPMFAASLWLIWVAVAQTGHDSLVYILGGVILIAFMVWLVKLKGVAAKITLALSGALLCALLVLLPAKEADAIHTYEAFSQQKLDEAIDEGRPVFVNMTAKWCVTCLLNEKVAIAVPATQAVFKDRNVLYLKGDWTDRDEAITNYLAKYGRSGVPLYVLYKDGKETVLPQLLTPSIVAESLGS